MGNLRFIEHVQKFKVMLIPIVRYIDTLTGEADTCMLFFAFLSQWDRLLKQRIGFCRSRFFPARIDPSWKSFIATIFIWL